MYWKDLDCPICGGEESLKEKFYFDSHGDAKIYWLCEKCGAESDSFDASHISCISIGEVLVSVQGKKLIWRKK